jgi:hypothetical protein
MPPTVREVSGSLGGQARISRAEEQRQRQEQEHSNSKSNSNCKSNCLISDWTDNTDQGMTAVTGTASSEHLPPAHEGFATPSGQLLAPVSSRRRGAPVGISLVSRVGPARVPQRGSRHSLRSCGRTRQFLSPPSSARSVDPTLPAHRSSLRPARAAVAVTSRRSGQPEWLSFLASPPERKAPTGWYAVGASFAPATKKASRSSPLPRASMHPHARARIQPS